MVLGVVVQRHAANEWPILDEASGRARHGEVPNTMNTQPSKDQQRFNEVPDVEFGDVEFKKGSAPFVIEIFDKGNSNSVYMYVDEASALRDWLNKVLP
jgi:hypothetical protein